MNEMQFLWKVYLAQRFNTRGPVPFYHLIQELYTEATDISLQLRMVVEGKFQRFQRNSTTSIWTMRAALVKDHCQLASSSRNVP